MAASEGGGRVVGPGKRVRPSAWRFGPVESLLAGGGDRAVPEIQSLAGDRRVYAPDLRRDRSAPHFLIVVA